MTNIIANKLVEPSQTSLITPHLQPTYALISVHGDPTAEIGKEGAGGQNVYVRSLGMALAQKGYKVDMFTRREDPNQAEIVEQAPGCRTIRLTAGPAKFIPRTELFTYLPAFVEAWLAFQKQSGRNYTLIHTNYWLSGWVGLQLKAQLGVPQVHTYHSIGAVKYQDVESLPEIATTRHTVEKACLEETDCVIATSPQEVSDLRQLVSEKGHIKVVPCGINSQHFGAITRKAAREQLGITANERMILYVGRFDKRKGIATLIEACAQLPKPFKLYLVGGSREGGEDSQEQQLMRSLVAELDLQDVTVFTGGVSQTHLPAYYAAANVCVVPSYYEPFGLVALESMAAGTPVIASNVGGLRHTVVDGETGKLVPPRNPTALAIAILASFVDPLRWQFYGTAGRKWVESHFSEEAVALAIHNVYQSLTDSELVPEAMQTQKLTSIPIMDLSQLNLDKEPELLNQLMESLANSSIQRT